MVALLLSAPEVTLLWLLHEACKKPCGMASVRRKPWEQACKHGLFFFSSDLKGTRLAGRDSERQARADSTELRQAAIAPGRGGSC